MNLIFWMLARAGGSFWAVPAVPVPSGDISYITADTTSTQIEDLIKVGGARNGGGIIAIDPSVTLQAQTISSNPTAAVWVTSGTVGSGLVSQSLPAINYAQNTRATIAAIQLNNGVTKVKLHTLNIGSSTNSGDSLGAVTQSNALILSGSTVSYTGVMPDLYMYNCEVFGRPMEPNGWSMRLRVADSSGFTVANTVTGKTTGTTAVVVAKPSATSILVKNISAGTGGSNPQSRYGATDVPRSMTFADFIGPFDDSEELSITGIGGTAISTYSAPYSEITVASSTGFVVGHDVSETNGGTTRGTIAEIASNTIYLKNVSSRPTVTNKAGTSLVVGATLWDKTSAANSAISAVTYDSRTGQEPTNLCGTYGFWGNYDVQGCYIHDLMRPIQATVGSGYDVTTATCNIADNDIDMAFRSGIALSNNYNSGNVNNHPPASTTLAFNRFTRGFGRNGEPDNPHANNYAIYTNGGLLETWTNIFVIGNLTVSGLSRHSYIDGQVQVGQSGATFFQEMMFVVNLYADYNYSGISGINIGTAQNSYILGNIVARSRPAVADGAPSGTNYGYVYSSRGEAGNISKYNIFETMGASSANTDSNGNYNMGQSNANYNGVFAGTFPLANPSPWGNNTERAALIAQTVADFAYDPAGAFAGFVGLVDYSNKKLDLTKLPEYVSLSTLVDQAQGADVNSTYWRKHWPQESSAVTVTNGKYRISATKDTGASFVTTAGVIQSGEWIQPQVHTAGAVGTASTATINIGGTSSSFTAITTATPYTSANNGCTAAGNNGGYLYNSATGAQTFTKAIFAIRMKKDATVSNSYIFSDAATGLSVRAQNTSTDTVRFYIAGTSGGVNISNAVSSAAAKTLILSVNMSAGYRDTAQTAIKAVLDGTPLTFTTNGTWANETTPDTITGMTLQGSKFALFDKAAATNTACIDGDVEFFWADWGDDSYDLPDIYDTAVFSKFYKDFINVGGNGYGVTGAQPKVFFYNDTAANWNTPINYGSLGAFTKAGTNSFA